MKELQQSIKVLQAEFDLLKKQSIDAYFINHEEFSTERGLLLASFKAAEMNVFNQTKFKQDHNALYNYYTEVKSVSRFLLK